MTSKAPLECFRYQDLLEDVDLKDVAERAFGREGLGIGVVTGVPDVSHLSRELFTLGHRFAALPEETKNRYQHPASSYSFGWSHGKETLEADKPDLAKGSYYANPCFDSPFADDPAMVARHPALAHPNIWPDSDVAGFSDAFKALGQVVVRVGVLVARQCDRYVETVHRGYEAGKLSRIVSTSRCCKGRLLHYFPRTADASNNNNNNNNNNTGVLAATAAATAVSSEPESSGVANAYVDGADDKEAPTTATATTLATAEGEKKKKRKNNRDDTEIALSDGGVEGASGAERSGAGASAEGGRGADEEGGEEKDSFSDWCGWHHDHSSLTGLVPAVLLDADGREVQNADPNCGLFIRSRQGALVKASLPVGESASSCLLFQIGETTQVHSAGALQATPHAVRSTSQQGVSREAFAVFMQPEWGESMDVPRGKDLGSTRSLHAASLLPRQAAPITERLRPGMDFGAFTQATCASYY